MNDDPDKAIRERAFEIWQAEGQPEGRSDQHWQQARVELADVQMQAGTARNARAEATRKKPVKTNGANAKTSGKKSSVPVADKPGRSSRKPG